MLMPGISHLDVFIAISETDGTRDKSQGAKILVKNNRLAKLGAVLISRERVFDLLGDDHRLRGSPSVFTLSTCFFWKETKDLRNLSRSEENMKASIARRLDTRTACVMSLKSLALDAKAAHANLRAYIVLELGELFTK